MIRSAHKFRLAAASAAIAALIAIPAIGQDKPKSLLPEGFGAPEPAQPSQPEDEAPARLPNDLLPESGATSGGASTGRSAKTSSGDVSAASGEEDKDKEDEEKDGEEETAVLPDLPPFAQRSTRNVGVLGPTDGDMGAAAFGSTDGKYLSRLMRSVRAPIVSRWASIVLRRALLSNVDTPGNLTGADWVAERAWLLLRMGEAESARLLVQAVDTDKYTPKMFAVAQQTMLASADPAGICPMVEPALKISKEQSWTASRAMCSSLAGESAVASSLIDHVRDRGAGRGIDGLLAEKVVGAGLNTRRSVKVEWTGVNELTTWRFGLAGATAVEMPPALLARANPRVIAWRARLPLIPVEKRVADAEVAAALGVLSNAALVDLWSAAAAGDEVDAAFEPKAELLGKAYAAGATADRVEAMRALWSETQADPLRRYARQVLTARAAARIKPDDALGDASGDLIASMFSAGLDVQAARWAAVAGDAGGESGALGWALLAVGSPARSVAWNVGRIGSFASGEKGKTGLRGQLFFAGMAGLGRIPAEDIGSIAEDLKMPVGRADHWTRAIDRAVAAREPATVAVLVALVMQGRDWGKVSPARFYHAVSALRRVGLGAEARMLAAEAVMRS